MRVQQKNGSVLVIVLMVLIAGTYLILESGKLLRIDYEGAAYQRVSASGGSLLHSGMTIARELLFDDLKENGSAVDHPFEDWAQADAFFAEVSDNFESGEIEGRIEAEDGKISLNSFRKGDGVGKGNREIFIRLVQELCDAHGIDADPNDFVTSIKIWLGEKDTQRDAEWYALEEPAYARMKGDFRTPYELRLVRWKGVEAEDRYKVLFGADGIPGLMEFVTVWGDGHINVNAAPEAVIRAMCSKKEMQNEFVREVLEYRGKSEHDFKTTWCRDIANRLGINSTQFPSSAFTRKSTVFRVSLTVHVGAGQLRSTIIVERKGSGCVVLFENIH